MTANKLVNNYHTHTYRCGHASGKDEEYVLAAIKLGIKTLGFSDHVPFPSGDFKPIRMHLDELDDYVSSLKILKEKYKEQIDIHIGLEAEYVKDLMDFYISLKDQGIEYYILGQHCSLEKDNTCYWYNSSFNDKNAVKRYVNDVIDGIKSGLFKYVAHPDLFMDGYCQWDDFAIKQSLKIINTAKKYNIPLEVNLGGLRYSEFKHKMNRYGKLSHNKYPYPLFWDLVSKEGNQVILGIDAHNPDEISEDIIKEAFEFTKEHKLNLIDKIDL